LEVKLAPGCIVDPPVTRTLSCPAAASFLDLHKALQVAFGWASTHTFDFKIKDLNAKPPPKLNLMDHIAKMAAQDRANFEALKSGRPAPEQDKGPRQNFLRIIQWSVPPMGLQGGVDMMHNDSRVHPETPEVGAANVKLGKILEQHKGAPIQYEYDFGDSWEHEVTVVGRATATEVFLCTGGEGHGVAEDVGSYRGWQNLKKAYRTQRPTKEQKDKMRWFETQASNADPQGLANGRDRFFDRDAVNFKLARM
jgi:hypothetical protein